MKASFKIIFTLFFSMTFWGLFAQEDASIEDFSEELQKLLGPEEGIARGVSFGMNKTEVKEMEAERGTELVLEADDLLYKVEINKNDYADIIYYLNDEEVAGIGIEFFVKDKEEENNLFKELTSFFSKKFGDYYKDEAGEEFWFNKDKGVKIMMSDESSEDTIEVEVEFSKLSEADVQLNED